MRKILLLMLLALAGCKDADDSVPRVMLSIDKVPPSELKTAKAKFPDVKFDTAWKLASGAIEVRGKNKFGKIHEVEFSPTGDIVETN
ncbi:MAG TPA: hypothetical protein VFE46_10185 [Pirellulales bacterium]|jgi:hypothetical protein|nr:hypothetical protein [Pirellulales bacterium]